MERIGKISERISPGPASESVRPKLIGINTMNGDLGP